MDLPPNICSRFFALRTVAAPRAEVGSMTVTPLVKVLTVRGFGSVFIRSRPAAVLVSANDRVSRICVRDMTRLVQAAMVCLTALGIFLLAVLANSRKER